MVWTLSLSAVGTLYTTPIYFDGSSGQYYRWINNAWTLADKGEVSRVLSDKAYIHMPTQDWLNFLNPRDFYFGMRMSFDLL